MTRKAVQIILDEGKQPFNFFIELEDEKGSSISAPHPPAKIADSSAYSLRFTVGDLADEPILDELIEEWARQDGKWGDQTHVDGTGPSSGTPWNRPSSFLQAANVQRTRVDKQARNGGSNWADILLEEVLEACASPAMSDALESELVQVMAVAGKWLRDTRRRRRIQEQILQYAHPDSVELFKEYGRNMKDQIIGREVQDLARRRSQLFHEKNSLPNPMTELTRKPEAPREQESS